MLPNSSSQGKKEGVCSLLSLFTEKYAFRERARAPYLHCQWAAQRYCSSCCMVLKHSFFLRVYI